MTRLVAFLASGCVLAGALESPAGSVSWDTVVFEDGFCSAEATILDKDKWIINHPGHDWWKQARTHIPNPGENNEWWLGNGEFPRVEDGACIIEHHLYNRYDLGNPNTYFLGGEIHTRQAFDPNQAYRFEAKVRWNTESPYSPYPGGLVTSFFLYGYDGANSDEIDFEFLSNHPEQIDTNSWNESNQNPQQVMPDGFDPTEWNTFRIYWYPDEPRVDWTWVTNPDLDEEILLRSKTDPAFIPDESMSLYFNFWAASELWEKAYNDDLQPVNDPNLDEVFAYEIDYVEVRIPEPHTCLLVGMGTMWLLRRRRRG